MGGSVGSWGREALYVGYSVIIVGDYILGVGEFVA
jgi:hypothetical protein